MNLEITAAAETIRQHFVDLGCDVGPVVISDNRVGTSCYFSIMGPLRVRISDHGCNPLNRVDEIAMGVSTTREDVARTISSIRDGMDRARTNAEAEIAKRDAYEAPFKAEWLRHPANGPASERGGIIARCYPAMGKADRKSIARRWAGN